MPVELSRELRYLLAVLGQNGPAPAPPPPPFNWAAFLDLAHWHGVTALAWSHLEPLAGLPDDVRAHMAARALYAAARQQVLSRELAVICTELARAGLPTLALKGPLLAARLYSDAGLRESCDLDLLIHRQHFPAAAAALAELGFQSLLPLSDWQRTRIFAHGDEIPLVRHDGVSIDLHARLCPTWFPGPRSLASLWRNAVAQPLAGSSIRTLDDTDLLLHTVLHGSKTLWDGLKWLCDLDRLLRCPTLDWPALLGRVADWNARRMLAWGLHLAHEYLRTPLPPGAPARPGRALEALTREVTALWDHPGAKAGVLKQTQQRMRLSENPLQHLAAPLRLALQPTLMDWHWVPLPAGLRWAHYLLRPLRMIWKYGFRGQDRPLPERSVRPAPAVLRAGCAVTLSGLFHSAEVDGAAVLIDLAAQRAFLLDPAGARLWQRLAQPTPLDSLQSEPERQLVDYLALEGALKVV